METQVEGKLIVGNTILTHYTVKDAYIESNDNVSGFFPSMRQAVATFFSTRSSARKCVVTTLHGSRETKDRSYVESSTVVGYANDFTTYECKVGYVIQPDNWALSSILEHGDDFSMFRLPLNSGGPIKSLACEIKITGRTQVRRDRARWIRVQITIPGDGEPDNKFGGWMLLD